MTLAIAEAQECGANGLLLQLPGADWLSGQGRLIFAAAREATSRPSNTTIPEIDHLLPTAAYNRQTPRARSFTYFPTNPGKLGYIKSTSSRRPKPSLHTPPPAPVAPHHRHLALRGNLFRLEKFFGIRDIRIVQGQRD